MAQSNETTQVSWRCIGLLSGYIPLFRGRVPWEQKASKREFNTVHGGKNRVYATAIGETPTSLYNLTYKWYCGFMCTEYQSKWYHMYIFFTPIPPPNQMHSTLSYIFLSYMQADLRKGATSCETPLILVLFKLSPLIFKAVRASDFMDTSGLLLHKSHVLCCRYSPVRSGGCPTGGIKQLIFNHG